MPQARGYKSKLVLDFETAFKAPPATPAGLVMPFNSINLKGTRPKRESGTITGRRDPAKPFDGFLSASGNIIVPVDGIAFGTWLKAMFGNANTTDNGDGTYTHVWKTVDDQPSLVIEKQFPDIGEYIKYLGCKIASFAMTVGGDDELVATLGANAASETRNTTPYDANPTPVSLSRFNNFQASLKLNGVAATVFIEFGFNLNFNLSEEHTIGSGGGLGALNEGIMGVSGNIKALFEDGSLLQAAEDSSENSIELHFDNGSEQLTITFSELQFERSFPEIPGPAGLYVEMGWQGYYDNAAEAAAVTIALTNDIDSY